MGERRDWLDLTNEDALDPELPICDPHHHFWHYPTSRYLIDEFLHMRNEYNGSVIVMNSFCYNRNMPKVNMVCWLI